MNQSAECTDQREISFLRKRVEMGCLLFHGLERKMCASCESRFLGPTMSKINLRPVILLPGSCNKPPFLFCSAQQLIYRTVLILLARHFSCLQIKLDSLPNGGADLPAHVGRETVHPVLGHVAVRRLLLPASLFKGSDLWMVCVLLSKPSHLCCFSFLASVLCCNVLSI